MLLFFQYRGSPNVIGMFVRRKGLIAPLNGDA